jgi:hypothetical protein
VAVATAAAAAAIVAAAAATMTVSAVAVATTGAMTTAVTTAAAVMTAIAGMIGGWVKETCQSSLCLLVPPAGLKEKHFYALDCAWAGSSLATHHTVCAATQPVSSYCISSLPV